MYKQDLALNNLIWLICHQTNPSLDIYKAHTQQMPIKGTLDTKNSYFG